MKKLFCLQIVFSLIYASSSSQIVHTPVDCGTEIGAVLNWNSNPPIGSNTEFNWNTPGSYTNTFTNLSGTGINATVTFTGETNTLFNWNNTGPLNTPSVASNASGGTADVLEYFTTGFTTGITITIDFNFPLQRFAFDMYHVNASGANGDKYIITAKTLTNTTIYPTFTSSVNPSYIANSATGVLDANNGSVAGTRDQAGVNFYDPATSIKSIVIQWFNCSTCSNAVHGSGLGSFEMCTLQQVLPVSLKKFNASSINRNSIISWEGAAESDVERYEVEFSLTGNSDFQQVESFQPGQTSYSFVHERIGDLYADLFYRLKIVGKNGNVTYSKLEPVHFSKTVQIQAYPSRLRSGQSINVIVPGNTSETFQAQLINLGGYKVKTLFLKGNSKTLIETDGLKPGIYALVITGAQLKETIKIVVN